MEFLLTIKTKQLIVTIQFATNDSSTTEMNINYKIEKKNLCFAAKKSYYRILNIMVENLELQS